MRINHIAYFSKNLGSASVFFETLNYRIGKKHDDYLLLFPPEKSLKKKSFSSIRQFLGSTFYSDEEISSEMFAEFHMPPNILILKSEIKTGIDHIAYETDSIDETNFSLIESKTNCPECMNKSFLINKSEELIGFNLKIMKSKNLKV